MRDWPRIWCEACKTAQPFTTVLMPADNLNDHDAADLLCSVCHLVIATFHDNPKEAA